MSGHVFWCGRSYRPAADCTCTTPLRVCRCAHEEPLHSDHFGCRKCGCMDFLPERVRVEQ